MAAGDTLAERGQAKPWEARNLSAATAGHHADSELGERVLLLRVVAADVGDRERPAVLGDRGVGLAARQLVPEGIGKSNARKGGGGGRDAGRGMEGGRERWEKEREREEGGMERDGGRVEGRRLGAFIGRTFRHLLLADSPGSQFCLRHPRILRNR